VICLQLKGSLVSWLFWVWLLVLCSPCQRLSETLISKVAQYTGRRRGPNSDSTLSFNESSKSWQRGRCTWRAHHTVLQAINTSIRRSHPRRGLAALIQDVNSMISCYVVRMSDQWSCSFTAPYQSTFALRYITSSCRCKARCSLYTKRINSRPKLQKQVSESCTFFSYGLSASAASANLGYISVIIIIIIIIIIISCILLSLIHAHSYVSTTQGRSQNFWFQGANRVPGQMWQIRKAELPNDTSQALLIYFYFTFYLFLPNTIKTMD